MIIIKNKYILLLGIFVCLLGISFSMSTVKAMAPPVSYSPYMIENEYGTQVSGSVSSLKSIDGNVVHWRSDTSLPALKADIWMNQPSSYYQLVSTTIKYKSSAEVRLHIQYQTPSGRSSVEFYLPATGSSYTTKDFNLPNNAIVMDEELYLLSGSVDIYVDYVNVLYYTP